MTTLYRHYKGGIYIFQFEAKMEATGEPVVVYQSYADGTVWVRPKDKFFGIVRNDRTGAIAPRFERLPDGTDPVAAARSEP